MQNQKENIGKTNGSKVGERLWGNSPEFIYFDVGGVIFDFEGGIKNLANLLGTNFKLCESIFKKYDPIICRGDITPQELWGKYKSETGFKGKDIDFADFWTDQFVPIPEIHEFIKELSKDYAVGLLTNIYPGVFQLMLGKSKIPNIPYATVIQSCEEKLIKPEDGFLQIAEERSGVNPNKIVLIDDAEANVIAVVKRGWNGVLFDRQKPSDAIERTRDLLSI